MNHNLYIVPHDFTPIGDAALKYAIHLGKKIRVDIQIVHLISDKSKTMATKQKLEKIVQSIDKPSYIKCESKIIIGSIFEDLGKHAKKEGAQLIIMGTHGLSITQKLFGSNVIKVVTSSEVPFLIIQKDTKIEEVKKIVAPIDMTKESLQITGPAGDLSKIFHSEVHVIAEKETDEILSRKQSNRFSLIKDQYDEKEVKYHFQLINERGSFQSKVIEYAKKNNANFFALAYHSESLFAMLDTFAQNIAINELKAPCLILNAKSASKLYF
ncbi:MAG: universal stress protein [Flavobacteriia bacterium]|nr:universal stress protein [Flavobacteriia bacterium]